MTIAEILAQPQPTQKMPLTATIVSYETHAKGHTVMLQDATGQLPNVLIWKSKLPNGADIGMVPVGSMGEFSLSKKAYQGKWDYNGYFNKVAGGAVNMSAPVPQAAPQQCIPQQQVHQPANAPAPKDDTPGRIARAVVVQHRDGLCQQIEQDYRQSGMSNTEIANMFAHYIETGGWPGPKAPEQQMSFAEQQAMGCNDPGPNDPIPFGN